MSNRGKEEAWYEPSPNYFPNGLVENIPPPISTYTPKDIKPVNHLAKVSISIPAHSKVHSEGGPTKEELQEYFRYEDGELIRIKTSAQRPDTLGKPLGGLTGTGYIQGWYKGSLYYLHHLIWIYHNGSLPDGFIDHINRDKTDNRIENLRVVTPQQNTFNRGSDYNAVSQFKGVSRKRDRWRARITVDGVEHSLGSFDTEIEAGLAYAQASKLLHGEYSIG